MERDGRNQLDARRYMPGLDGLRALAVLAVIAYHLHLPWAPGGLLGVCIFFVLSGYLITDILVAQWQFSGGLNLKEFWLGRARRLLPALFVMLAGVIVWLSFCDPGGLSSLWNDVIAVVFYISNWWLIFHQVSYFASFGPPSPLGHLWSLAIEEQFYLLWPLLLWLGLRYIPRRGRLIRLIMALAFISAISMAIIYQPGMDPSRVYYGTDTRCFALLIGAALALIWPSRRLSADLPPRRRLFLDAAGGAALLAVLVMIWQNNQYQTFLYYGGLFLFAIISAVLVAVLAHPASRLGRVFGMQPLRWLGVCSYGIYLWHYPVIILTSPGFNTEGLSIVLAGEQMLLSILLAAVSWYFIEEPIRHGKWKKQWKRLPIVLRQLPRLLGAHGKAASTSIILIMFVFVSVGSGCSLISHTHQQSIPPRAAAKTEQTVKPVATQVQESKDNETESQAGTEAANEDPDKRDVFTGKGVTAIGDSVMVEVGPALQELFPDIVVDSKIGRQMYQAPQVIKNLKDQGMLGNTVIIELGANGAFTEKQFADILELLGKDRQIVLINTRVPKPWESVVNKLLAQTADDNSNIKLVDWYTASSGHNEYFYSDGVHLQQAGLQAYASLVVDAVNP
ncbi:MAG: acyltransferase family protein [Syntrophomonadaceae bacterium]|nr:acyltransferase family protein [Syntrophomonadaceae bacterium]MDD3898067.1 acyltransferase family protein [Syntrophomonadaceae bacterium]